MRGTINFLALLAIAGRLAAHEALAMLAATLAKAAA